MVSCPERSRQLTQPTCATVLVNRSARRVPDDFDAGRVVRYLGRHGIDAQAVEPGSPDEATRAARASAERGDSLLFVVGGDGSLRDAAQGLAGSQTAMAAIPAGTVNIWAKEAGIPKGLRASIDSHLAGRRERVDLGRANGTCFLLMAGVGWDAAVARDVSHSLKRRVGDVAYMLQAVRMARTFHPRDAAWLVDGERVEAPLAWMILGNTRLYGGRVRITDEALVDDGRLDIVALCPRGLGDGTRLAAKLVAGRLQGDGGALQWRAHEVRIETRGLPLQLDGDFAGETPVTFTVERHALLVSIPAGPLPALFGAAPAL